MPGLEVSGAAVAAVASVEQEDEGGREQHEGDFFQIFHCDLR